VGSLTARRVLIADSDSAVRQRLFAALLAVDVFSDLAGSVPDALEKLDGESYGVILIDIGLAGGDPEEVLGRIARLPLPQRPVVLVAASNFASARSLDVDVVQIVLRRPLSLHQTVDVIRSCIEIAVARPAADDDDSKRDQLTS
jgi:CheY-like chemotaxis protein